MTTNVRSDVAAAPVGRLWAAVLLGYLSLGATLQLLPSWVIGTLHGSSIAAGAAVGLAFVATAAGRPIAGAGADRGHPQRFVVLGGVLVATGSVISMVARNIIVLLVGRVVMGAGEALLFGAAIPWVLLSCPPGRRGKVSGLFGLSMWGGLALGPVCASVVDHTFGPERVWTLVVALAVASSCLSLTIVPVPAPRSVDVPSRLSLRRLVPRTAILPGVVFGLAGYGYGAVSAGLVLYMLHHHLASAAALPTFAAAFLGVRALGSKLVDRWTGPRVASASLTVAAVGAASLAVVSSTGSSLLGSALLGAGTSLLFPATVAWSLARGTASATAGQGASIGVSTSFWDLGIAAGGVLTGTIIRAAGYPTAWAVTAVALVLAAGIALRSARRRDR